MRRPKFRHPAASNNVQSTGPLPPYVRVTRFAVRAARRGGCDGGGPVAAWPGPAAGLVLAAWPTSAALGASPLEAGAAGSGSFVDLLFRGAELPGAIIIAMSVAAVAILLDHLRADRRRTIAPAEVVDAARGLLEARRYSECVTRLQASGSIVAEVLVAAFRQSRRGFEAVERAAEGGLEVWTSRLRRRADGLHVLGHLGPLMGLLGTILGMIRAFSQMQATQGAYRADDLAGGIALALVNTFLGLVLAIVGLGLHAVCRNRVEAFMTEAAFAVREILEPLRPAPSNDAAAEGLDSRLRGPERPAPPPPASRPTPPDKPVSPDRGQRTGPADRPRREALFGPGSVWSSVGPDRFSA